uniref:Transposase n=1 Tax=Rhodococcus sp. NS1 TaxID=402236 RepID=A0A097SPU7_9NOCA|nr:hypothetical protein LRS1606.119 [Rhodococcus sp. NS1]
MPAVGAYRVCWRVSSHGRMRSMGAPRKYPEELKERATRLAVEARRDPGSKTGAIKQIADQLGIHPEALAHLGAPGKRSTVGCRVGYRTAGR